MKMETQIYLDASITERFFKKALIDTRRKISFIPPKIFQFFKQKQEIKLFVSSFTLAENFEHMWKHYQATPQEIINLTDVFLHEFKINPILSFNIKPEILRWVRKYKLEAKDVIHLSIAKDHEIFLLTDDNKLQANGKAIYDKIISEEILPVLFKSSINAR